eukprot:4439314-Pyramimonas_sp.AAC.2
MQTGIAAPLRFSIFSACVPSQHRVRARQSRIHGRALTGTSFAPPPKGLLLNSRQSATDTRVGVWTNLQRRRSRLGIRCDAAGDNGDGKGLGEGEGVLKDESIEQYDFSSGPDPNSSMDMEYLSNLTRDELSVFDQISSDVGTIVMGAIHRRSVAVAVREKRENEVGHVGSISIPRIQRTRAGITHPCPETRSPLKLSERGFSRFKFPGQTPNTSGYCRSKKTASCRKRLRRGNVSAQEAALAALSAREMASQKAVRRPSIYFPLRCIRPSSSAPPRVLCRPMLGCCCGGHPQGAKASADQDNDYLICRPGQ